MPNSGSAPPRPSIKSLPALPWSALAPSLPLSTSRKTVPRTCSIPNSRSLPPARSAVAVGQVEENPGRGVVEQGEVDAVAAVERVVALPATQHVVAVAAVEPIVAVAAIDGVVAVGFRGTRNESQECSGRCGGANDRRLAVTIEDVVAVQPPEVVVAPQAVHLVGPAGAGQDLAAVGPGNDSHGPNSLFASARGSGSPATREGG